MKATVPFLFFLSGCCMTWTEALIVNGRVGGTVRIKCNHNNAQNRIKFFCKGKCREQDVLVTSETRGSDREWFLDPDDCDGGGGLFVCLFTFLLWLITRHMRNTVRNRRQESNREEEKPTEYENESPVGLFGGSPSVYVLVGREEQRQTLSPPKPRRPTVSACITVDLDGHADAADSGQTCLYQSLNLNLERREGTSHNALK
ncbi:unnamed protein product [Arctogadus glacialis]